MTAFEQIVKHIEDKKSFVLEAGAGSGKTYTLIQTLNYLIENKGDEIQYLHQKIICITYTNVAKNEIIERLEHNPLVLVSTIHEFLWDSIKSYQKQLKIELCELNEIRYNEAVAGGKELKYIQNLSERVSNIKEINYQDTAFRNFEEGLLHHDDIITLSKMVFEKYEVFTKIISEKYPYIFVDEYQDTAEEITTSLIDFLLERNKGKIVVGFYGDSHQKIYDSGVGDLEEYYNNEKSKKIELVKKEENYRSSKSVVELLNNFRTNIQQKEQTTLKGSVTFVYCRNYPRRELKGENGRTKDEKITDYEKRIEPLKNTNYEKITSKLENIGWNFGKDSDDKILIIANSRVAKRANFGELYQIFSKRYGQRTKDQLLDRNHPLVKLFVGYTDKKTSQEREIGIEHLVEFWKTNNYNEVLRFLKKYSNLFEEKYLEHKHKIVISEILNKLNILRETKTIKEVLEFIEENKLLKQTEGLSRFIQKITTDLTILEDDDEKDRIQKDIELHNSLIALSYTEIINFFKHTQNNTVFSTKHSTKGEEYRNVLTVIDDTEWKQEYNFESFFNNSEQNDKRKLRTRNLFYVECSRPKENLVVLALSEMNEEALKTLKSWFGVDNVISIDNL